MNLREMRAIVLENSGLRLNIGFPQMNRVINRAVEHVTNLVELRAKFYNMNPTPITINVTTASKTFALNASNTPVIRKIVQVERTDGPGADPIDAQIIDFREKNQYGQSVGSLYTGLTLTTVTPYVYFTRDSVGIWTMGFPSLQPDTMVIDVYYAPQITELSADTSVPREVPEQHHELIAMRATIVAMDQQGLSSDRWIKQYAELRSVMESDLETWQRTRPRVRRFRGTGDF